MMTTRWGRFVLGAVAICTAPAMASSPVIDGLFDGPSVYQTGFEVSFGLQNLDDPMTENPFPGGQIWFHVESGSGDVSVAFIQPKGLVDNSYGDELVGWGSENHKLKDLEKDKANFVFLDGMGNEVLDLTLEYSKRKVGNERVFSTKIKDIDPNNQSLVLAHESSMGANFAAFNVSDPGFFDPLKQASSPETVGDTYVVADSDHAAWEFAVIYEFKIDGSLFPGGINLNPDGGGGLLGISLPTIHDSPNKLAKNKIMPIIGDMITSGGGVIPEPSSLALLGLGSLGLLGYRCRRRRIAAAVK